MGMSASADIVFGVDLKDRNPLLPWIQSPDSDYGYNDHEGDDAPDDLIELLPEFKELEKQYSPWLDERYLNREKVPAPPREPGKYVYFNEFQAWQDQNPWFQTRYSKWSEVRDGLEAKIPIEVEHYSYLDGGRSYALVLKSAPKLHVYDYGSGVIDPSMFREVDYINILDAQEFCESIDILPPFENPQWHLLVSYG